jgi:hypothetical protein
MRTLAGRRLPRTSTALLAALLVFSSMSLLPSPPAGATTPFSERAAETLNGDLVVIGNALIECDASIANQAADCTASHNDLGWDNNPGGGKFVMKQTRVDTSFALNSSSADLVLPAGATVRHAYLYWVGSSSAANRTSIKWKPPRAAAPVTLTSPRPQNTATMIFAYRSRELQRARLPRE